MKIYTLVHGKKWVRGIHAEPLNRGFLYGDGFFDTMLLSGGIPGFWSRHFARIRRTLAYMKMDAPAEMDHCMWELFELIRHLKASHHRMRLCVFRAGGGKFHPDSNEVDLLAMVEPYNAEVFSLAGSQQVGIASQVLPSMEGGNFKLIAKHQQVLAGMEAYQKGLSDLLLFNDREALCESIGSNVFLVKDGQLITPHLDSGCLNGVIRSVIIDHFEVQQRQDISLQESQEADEIFITNSISGLQSVFFKQRLQNKKCTQVLEELRALRTSSLQDFPENWP